MAGRCSTRERDARDRRVIYAKDRYTSTRVLLENLEVRDYLGDLGVDWSII
jgi:hypothetical protein